MMRNYTNTNKLFEVIEGLHNNTVGAVRKLAMDRNAMMRYMYIEGGLSTRYVPIQVSEQLPTPITNDNEEDDNFDYGLDGEDWNTQGNNGDEKDEKEENEVEETKVDNPHDKPNENEQTRNEETNKEEDATARTTEEEIEAYQLGLEQPNSVIKLEKENWAQ